MFLLLNTNLNLEYFDVLFNLFVLNANQMFDEPKIKKRERKENNTCSSIKPKTVSYTDQSKNSNWYCQGLWNNRKQIYSIRNTMSSLSEVTNIHMGPLKGKISIKVRKIQKTIW